MAATTRERAATKDPRRWVLMALAWILLLAAALRFLHLDAKSFWLDEGVSVAMARLGWGDFLRLLWRREANMSLYYVLLRGWMGLGDSEFIVRSLSAAFSVATLPALYALGRRLFKARVGLLAALLLAVHAFHVRYAQEARGYALAVLLVTCSTWLLVRALQEGSGWRAYAVVSALAVYAHFFAVLVVVAQWIGVASSPQQLPPHRKAVLQIAGLTSPLWVFILTTGAGPLAWIGRPRLTDLWQLMNALSGNAGFSLMALYATGVAVVAALAWKAEAGRRPYLLILSWGLAPVAITLAASLLKGVLLPRYLLVCVPALALMAGVALEWLGQRSRALAVVGLAAMLGLSLQGVRSYYGRDFDLARQDWRGATQQVLSQVQPGDAVLFYPALGRMPFEYYRGARSGPEVVFPAHDERVVWRDFMGRPDAAALAHAGQHRRVWAVMLRGHGDELRNFLEKKFGAGERAEFAEIEIVLYSKGKSIAD